ncbi:hypothetical protein Y032_0004g1837 [Ancylostoma ceylanicum]|uniref:Uncharacterized protein n=1 Tax=Ancylostoma ceylanicum TaxID=53326 RepID=A0A016VU88_9BILA|nr:hypothetical protein Y032_0004g1837 [Ancylostoma ceylanicum]
MRAVSWVSYHYLRDVAVFALQQLVLHAPLKRTAADLSVFYSLLSYSLTGHESIAYLSHIYSFSYLYKNEMFLANRGRKLSLEIT